MWVEANLCWDGTAGDFWLVFQQPVFAELPPCVDSAKPRHARPSLAQRNTCSEEGVPFASHKAPRWGASGCITSKRGCFAKLHRAAVEVSGALWGGPRRRRFSEHGQQGPALWLYHP